MKLKNVGGRPQPCVAVGGGCHPLYEYDEEGNRISETKNNREQSRIALDSRNRVVEVLDGGADYKNRYEYDPVGNLIQLTNPENQSYTLTYNNMSRTIDVQDTLGHKAYIEYDLNGNVVTSTDKLGNKTGFVYDTSNRMVEAKDAFEKSVHVFYDKLGNKTQVVDKNGNRTNFRYNKINKLSSVTDALGASSRYYYDLKRNMVKTRTANGAETRIQYDLKNRVVNVLDALGNKSILEYDAVDNVTHMKNANGELSTIKYDVRNRPVEYVDPLGNNSKFVYDNFDNLIRAVDPLGNASLLTYNSRNKLIATQKPSGAKNKIAYDLLDHATKKTDALGRSTNYSYDSEGRLVQVSDALGNSTRYSYDAEGRLLSYIDANNNGSTYGYDALSQLIRETDALQNTTRFDYDPNGNVTEKLLPGGDQVAYAYDKKNRLTQKSTSDGLTNKYQYDLVNNLISIENTNYKERYGYDLLNRKTDVNNITHNKQIEYRYDPVGRRTYMSSPKAPGSGAEYRYDKAGRLAGVKFPETPNMENLIRYDAAGRVMQKQYVNGVVKNISYNTDGNVSRLNESLNGKQILNFAYEHDKVGNPVRITRENGRVDEMSYDKLDRMTSFVRGGYSMQYTYDAVGNRIQETGFVPASPITGVSGGVVSTNSQYNELNQLTQRGNIKYKYDNKGNRIEKNDPASYGPVGAITTYNYNVENQLVGVTLPDAKTYEYKYDSLDRRIYKKYAIGTDTFANHIIYDGRQTLYELNEDESPLAQYNFLPHPSLPYGEPVLRKFYGYKGRGSAGGSGGKQTIGNTHYYHTDAIGTTWKMTNHQGQEIFEYDYDPWGNILNSEFTEPYNRFLYTGKEYDYETQMTHIDARDYDMQSATWIQKDPYNLATLQLPQTAQGLVAMLGQNAQGMLFSPKDLNAYSYVYNNPARYKDASGHFVFTAFAIGAGVGLIFEIVHQLLSDKEMSVGERFLRLGISMLAGGLSAGGGYLLSGLFNKGVSIFAGGVSNGLFSMGTAGVNNHLFNDNNNVLLSGLFGFGGGLLGSYTGTRVANLLAKAKLNVPGRSIGSYGSNTVFTTYVRSLNARTLGLSLASAESATNAITGWVSNSIWPSVHEKLYSLNAATCNQFEYTAGWSTDYSNVFSSTNSAYDNSVREESQRQLYWSYGLQWDYMADGRRTFSVDPSTIVTLYTNPEIEIVNSYYIGY
ncbi:MAG: RHS repeat-associated core domain-containing protein [Leptospirales bacterium]